MRAESPTQHSDRDVASPAARPVLAWKQEYQRRHCSRTPGMRRPGLALRKERMGRSADDGIGD